MTSLFEGDIYNSADILKEIQTERIVYQINSSSNTRKVSDKMKRGAEAMIKAIENAQNIAIDKKKLLEETKVNLFERRDKMKKLEQELEHTRKRIESSTKKVLNLETEVNKITLAMEKIKEASQEIGQKYLEQSQNELMNQFVKVTSDAEKAQSDLNATKKMESTLYKKLQEIEIDYDKLEIETRNETREVEGIMSNVSITIQHIMRTYDEIVDASKDLLKSAISPNVKSEEQHIGEQNQAYDDIKMAV